MTNWRAAVDRKTSERIATSVGRLAYIAKRRSALDGTLGGARDILAGLERDGHVFALTKGQVSMIDFVIALVERCAPADVTLWTWCLADFEAACLHELVESKAVASLRLIMDEAGARRDRPIVAEIQRRYGLDCVRVTKTHCKVAMVSGQDQRYLARGSMNLNRNLRMENCDVSEGGPAYDVAAAIVDEIWSKVGPLPVAAVDFSTANDIFELVGRRDSGGWDAGLSELAI